MTFYMFDSTIHPSGGETCILEIEKRKGLPKKYKARILMHISNSHGGHLNNWFDVEPNTMHIWKTKKYIKRINKKAMKDQLKAYKLVLDLS